LCPYARTQTGHGEVRSVEILISDRLLEKAAPLPLRSEFLHPFVSKGILDPISALVPGVAFSYMAWEFRKYLAAMDELERRIHMESITWTYLSGLAMAMLLGGFSQVYGWRLNPGWFIVLEAVRARWTHFVSRRYQ